MIVTSQPLPAGDPTPGVQTFRTFVPGPQNALAYNAALTVARTPGAVYNPLYLCGGSGLGKTHLLHAVAAYLRPRLHGAEVLVVSDEAFAQDFVSHLRRGLMPAFRRRYRRAGALLIDGVAILAGHEPAAEELVRTLDALREANRQIVIADAERPTAVRGLPERLRSCLCASVIVAMNLPDEATRLEILRRKCARGGLTMREDALATLAARMRGSIRDLETALARLAAAAAARHASATSLLAAQVASEINRAARQPPGRVRAAAVVHAVCAYYGLPRAVLLSKSREMTVAQARQVAMYLLREDAGLTATQVGQELGRDHSTVLHGHARIARALGGGDAIMNVVLDSIRKSLVTGRVPPAC
jgi:chromosomal replication initiator protein